MPSSVPSSTVRNVSRAQFSNTPKQTQSAHWAIRTTTMTVATVAPVRGRWRATQRSIARIPRQITRAMRISTAVSTIVATISGTSEVPER